MRQKWAFQNSSCCHDDLPANQDVIRFSFVTLFETSTELGDGILSSPAVVLPLCDSALLLAQDELRGKQSLPDEFTVKTKIHTRVTGKSASCLSLPLSISIRGFNKTVMNNGIICFNVVFIQICYAPGWVNPFECHRPIATLPTKHFYGFGLNYNLG